MNINEIRTELNTEIAILNETKMTDVDLHIFAVRIKEITEKIERNYIEDKNMDDFKYGYKKAIADCFKLLCTFNNLGMINISKEDIDIIYSAFTFENVLHNT